MADVKYVVTELENGTLNISEDVIRAVAQMAVKETEGVYGLHNRGVEMTLENGSVRVSAEIIVYYGYSLLEVARKVQERVATEVEAGTGVPVDRVSIRVVGIAVKKKKQAEN